MNIHHFLGDQLPLAANSRYIRMCEANGFRNLLITKRMSNA